MSKNLHDEKKIFLKSALSFQINYKLLSSYTIQ